MISLTDRVASPYPLAVTFTSLLNSVICRIKTHMQISRRSGGRDINEPLCGKKRGSYLRCPCGIVVVPVKVECQGIWPAGQLKVNVHIIFRFLSIGPVFSDSLVHHYGSLEGESQHVILSGQAKRRYASTPEKECAWPESIRSLRQLSAAP